MSDTILVEKLKQYIDPFKTLDIAWDKDLSEYDAVTEFVEDDDNLRDAKYDYGRIKHFLMELEAGRSLDPIILDNKTAYYTIYPEPILLDGYHRFCAHILHGSETMEVEYSGLVELLEYLQGKTDEVPE